MKKLRIVLAAGAILLLVGAGTVTYFAVRVFRSSELYVIQPETLGGRPALSDSQHTADVQRLANRLAPSTNTAAVYGEANDTDLLLLAGGTLEFGLPGPRMAAILDVLTDEGFATAEMRPKAPWPFGGIVRCGPSTYQHSPAIVCAWSDDGTLGVVIAPKGTLDVMWDSFAALRVQVEKRGNQFP